MDLVLDGLAPPAEIHQMAPRFIHPLSGNIQAVDGQIPFLSVYFGMAPLHAGNGVEWADPARQMPQRVRLYFRTRRAAPRAWSAQEEQIKSCVS